MINVTIRTLLLITILATVGCSSRRAQADSKKEQVGLDATKNLIIYYDADAGNEELLKAVQNYGAEVIYLYEALKGIAIGIPDGKSIEESIAYFEKVPGVTSVDRDGVATIQQQLPQEN